mmetsp:Transcript_14255/g.41568  ORF Transcript_14255/g.41568 Transcript_14255/m.41568 type:complete len:242 (+) Transcript_14255:236-961(+)
MLARIGGPEGDPAGGAWTRPRIGRGPEGEAAGGTWTRPRRGPTGGTRTRPRRGAARGTRTRPRPAGRRPEPARAAKPRPRCRKAMFVLPLAPAADSGKMAAGTTSSETSGGKKTTNTGLNKAGKARAGENQTVPSAGTRTANGGTTAGAPRRLTVTGGMVAPMGRMGGTTASTRARLLGTRARLLGKGMPGRRPHGRPSQGDRTGRRGPGSPAAAAAAGARPTSSCCCRASRKMSTTAAQY